MNKIIVDKELLEANNLEAILNIKGTSLKINCFGNNILIIKNDNVTNLEINLQDDSSLEIYIYNQNRNLNRNVKIEQNNNTKINYYEAYASNVDINESITNILKGNNNYSYIKLNCISFAKEIMVDVMAIGENKTKNNVITEDVKGINHGGKIMIKPNMEIATPDIMANHLVTIGPIMRDYLFYLASKGISESKANILILDGFIKGTFPKYKDELIGGEDNE